MTFYKCKVRWFNHFPMFQCWRATFGKR